MLKLDIERIAQAQKYTPQAVQMPVNKEFRPKGADTLIQRFLTAHNLSHEQYSGYHSKHKATDLEIFDLIREISDTYPGRNTVSTTSRSPM